MIVVNPNGNGLTNGNLALATATAAQVLSGYTFYAGDKELKTGVLVPTPKVATGEFDILEYGQTLTINCGFRPVAVMIRISDMTSGAILVAFNYNGKSYLSAARGYYNIDAGYWEGTTDIKLTSTGFSVTNNDTNWSGMAPFSEYGVAIVSFSYVAIG